MVHVLDKIIVMTKYLSKQKSPLIGSDSDDTNIA